MTIAAMAREDVAAVLADVFSDLKITVNAGGSDITGSRVELQSDSSLEDIGEDGSTTGAVRVAANALTMPTKGATLKIDGVDSFVMGVDMDSAGAFWVIRYTQQKTSVVEDDE